MFKYQPEHEGNACGGTLGITEPHDSAAAAAACQTDESVKSSREVHRVLFSVEMKRKTFLAAGQNSSSSFSSSFVKFLKLILVIGTSSRENSLKICRNV